MTFHQYMARDTSPAAIEAQIIADDLAAGRSIQWDTAAAAEEVAAARGWWFDHAEDAMVGNHSPLLKRSTR